MHATTHAMRLPGKLQAHLAGAIMCPGTLPGPPLQEEQTQRRRHRKGTPDMATLSSQSFGDLLRRHRLAAGLTQEELAGRAGLSVRGLSDLERGARRAPHRETVHLLCEALQLSEAERARLETAARHRGISAARAQGRSLPLPHGNLHSSPFVGRTQELALLDHLLGDGPQVLLVAGEPGIGKSRLCR